jgi:hypothetical protein
MIGAVLRLVVASSHLGVAGSSLVGAAHALAVAVFARERDLDIWRRDVCVDGAILRLSLPRAGRSASPSHAPATRRCLMASPHTYAMFANRTA